MFGRILLRITAVCALVAAFSLLSLGQDLDTVTIAGRVTDINGLAVVGATVTATNAETGEARTATSNDDGRYLIVNLKPGGYKIGVASSGFGTQETSQLTTIAAQRLEQNFRLSPADVRAETTVTVTDDDTPAVDTTRTIVGGTVTEREIEELPVDSRNPLDLVLTLGGTAEEQLSTRDLADDRGIRGTSQGNTPEEAGIFGLSGGAAYSNNVTINGLDNNDDRSAGFRFQPSMDSIREVQVVTNQFSAEYGRASGGRVNLYTRSGGNRFRGRAYYYFRDESLNANTWNNNRRNVHRPPFQDHNPGFTFGGPIVKNKLFFFSSYEYDTIFDTTLLDAWVPLSGGNPNYSLPAPNDPAAGTVSLSASSCSPQMCLPVVVGHYLTPTDTPATRHTFSTRVDWNVTNMQSLIFEWQLGRFEDLRAFSGTNRIADSIIGRVRDTDAYNLTHNLFFSSKLSNQARVQYSKLDPNSAQQSGPTSPAILITFTVPTEASSSTMVFGSTSNSSDRKENRWQFQDTLTWVNGPVTWRFGADVHNVDTTFIDRFDATGTYTFSNFSFFSGSSVSRLQQNFGNESRLHNRYTGVFAQAEWRMRPNLTMTAGLRYERESVLEDNNNFGPRLAFAWNPFKKGAKTVIRFGGGIFYNRVLLRTVDDYTANTQTLRFDSNSFNLPAGTTVTGSVWRNALASIFPNKLTLDTVIPINASQSFTVSQLSRPASEFRSLSSDLKIPESYQLNAGFEREISKGLVFETNVTFNRTAHLWRETNPNAAVLPAGLSDLNTDGQITLTDYLLGITTGPNRFFNGPYGDNTGVGSATSGFGTHIAPDATSANCTTGTAICYVNVNSTSSNSSTNCSTTTTTNTPVCRAFAAVNPLRPFFSTLGAVQLERVAPIGNSRYIGASFELRKRLRDIGYGFRGSWRLAYTLSKLMDDGIVNTSDPTLPGDFAREWSRSLSDRRHRIAVTATIDTPRWMGKLRFSPLFRWGSSAPFNLSAGGIDRSLDDVSNDRPSFSGDTKDIKWREFGSSYPQALADRFTLAPIGSPGNLGRNAGHGPQQLIFNLMVTREFRFSERVKLRPSVEMTNPLNMAIFSFGSNFINFDQFNSTNPVTVQNARNNFLAPTRTIAPRRFRLGLRLDF